MDANELARLVIEVIQGEPEEIMQLIQTEDWEGLQDEFYYTFANANEG